MSTQDDLLKKIISHCKEYGFVYPSSEIYDGVSAVYDYGPNGVALKRNIIEYWWNAMVRSNENIVGLDSAIFMHPTTWKASGHVDAFNDPMIDNKDSKKRYRADQLIEGYIEKIQQKINKEIKKARKRFGDSFDEDQYLSTNPRVLGYQEKIKYAEDGLKDSLEKEDFTKLKGLIEELEIVDPVSGSKNWTDIKNFNLMFETDMGSVAEDAHKIYLRPETAQGIFVNFLNVLKTSRMKVPFGIAQVGKAFRNEIVARQFIFRMREFEQMEMQFFVHPNDSEKWFNYWKDYRINWHKNLGFDMSKYRFHDHLKLAHYANAATDIEFDFPMGFRELEGIHSRGNFDLKQHEEHSGKKLQYFDPKENTSYTPHVIETSIGLDRTFLAVISAAYTEETLEDGSSRIVLKIPPFLAPTKIAVLPLVKRDGLDVKAKEIFNQLKFEFNCSYDEKDAIGRRYRRGDAVGIPYAITIDQQTLDDNTVTIRERDSMKQERVTIDQLVKVCKKKVQMTDVLKSLNLKEPENLVQQ